MKQSQKKYIIIGSLCAVVLMMIVGYAAFNSVLNINGTSSINSNWDVKITGITLDSSKGATDNEGSPSYDNTNGLEATFNTNFTTPGDYATYKIEITNNGSMDATLKNITMPENTNNDIIFYLNKDQNNTDIANTLKQNDTLFKTGGTGNVGYVYVTVLYRDYENQQTATTKTQSMTITFDFEQADGSGGSTGGNILTIDDLKTTAVTEGDGLYADAYETGRYIYKGANPSNYITFNNETWRIMSVENDGTLKIIRNESIGTMEWDAEGTYGSNNWARPATLNTYLNNETEGANSYYNTLSSEAKGLIQNHTWGIGSVTNNNTDLAGQISSENRTTWSGKIGLMSVSDYLRANTNTEQCSNLNLYNNINRDTCKTTNYIFSLVPSSDGVWTISPNASSSNGVFYVNSNGDVNTGVRSPVSHSNHGVFPALYLTSNIHLDGEGTSSSPYTIVS